MSGREELCAMIRYLLVSIGLVLFTPTWAASPLDAEKFLYQYKPTFDVRFDPQGKLAEFH
jgi:hypothetical protein